MIIKRLALIAVLLLTGCQAVVYGTASDFDKVAIGMTKQQVIQTLGSPRVSQCGWRQERGILDLQADEACRVCMAKNLLSNSARWQGSQVRRTVRREEHQYILTLT